MQQGQTEVLISSLPGFPDGISLSEDGNFWIAMVAPTQAFVHILPFRYVYSVASSEISKDVSSHVLHPWAK